MTYIFARQLQGVSGCLQTCRISAPTGNRWSCMGSPRVFDGRALHLASVARGHHSYLCRLWTALWRLTMFFAMFPAGNVDGSRAVPQADLFAGDAHRGLLGRLPLRLRLRCAGGGVQEEPALSHPFERRHSSVSYQNCSASFSSLGSKHSGTL